MASVTVPTFLTTALTALSTAGATAGGAIASGATALGVGAETAADIGAIAGPTLVGAGEGAALGAGTAALTGGNIGKGAEFGAGTAGLLSAISPIAGVLGGDLGGTAGIAGATPATTGAVPPATGATGAAATAPAGAAASTPITGGGALSAAGSAPAAGSIAAPVDPTATGVLSSLSSNPYAAPGSVGIDGYTPTAPTIPGYTANAAPAATQPSSISQFIKNPSLANAGNIAASNPQAVIGALGLGYDVLNQGNIPGLGPISSFASQEEKAAQANQSYVNTGTLPPGAQAALTQATEAAKAQVRSKYAQLGMSGSTAETQELSNVDISAVGEQFSIASQLLQAGASQANVTQEMLNEILGVNEQQEAATTQAISSFAGSLGGTPLYIKAGG